MKSRVSALLILCSFFVNAQTDNDIDKFVGIDLKDSVYFKVQTKYDHKGFIYLDTLAEDLSKDKMLTSDLFLNTLNDPELLLFANTCFPINKNFSAYIVNCISKKEYEPEIKHYPSIKKILFLLNKDDNIVTDTLVIASTISFSNPINSGNQIIEYCIESTLYKDNNNVKIVKLTGNFFRNTSYVIVTGLKSNEHKKETYIFQKDKFIKE